VPVLDYDDTGTRWNALTWGAMKTMTRSFLPALLRGMLRCWYPGLHQGRWRSALGLDLAQLLADLRGGLTKKISMVEHPSHAPFSVPRYQGVS